MAMHGSTVGGRGHRVADVFLSYSRRDGEFVKRLTSALQEHGKDVWLDVEGIRDAEVFPEALRRAIEASDAFVFLISPDAVRSAFCVEEVQYAARLNKRIVPLARRPVADEQIPEEVRVRNWIPAGEHDDFTTTVARLVRALDTDLEWERQHTRLTVRALEWEQSDRDPSFLLRGADLRAAERWLAAGADKDPGPTALEIEYVSTARKRLRRGRLLVAGGGVVVLAVIGVLAALLAAPGAGVHRRPNAVAAINPRNDKVVASVPVGTRPGTITFGSGSLWVANLDDQTVSRISPRTLSTSRTLPVSGPPTGLAASAHAVWVAESTPGTSSISVNPIDPQFDSLGPTTRLGNIEPGGPGAIAAQGSTVWAAPSSGLLARLDAGNGRVTQRIDPNSGPAAIAIGDRAVWVTDTAANNVIRIAPGGQEKAIAVGNGPTGLAVGLGAVWVADALDDALVRIDPRSDSVTSTIHVGRSPAGVAIGAGSVWVANSGDGTVSRIDPRSGRVLAKISVGGSPQAITVADGRAWVTVDSQTLRPPAGTSGGGTLRIEALSDVDYMDPALAYQPNSWQLLYATCAMLLNYSDKSGPAGSRLIPEVAQSLPTRSADDRTYTFAIRRGFRFSPPSNQPVTAQTFKYTIERTLNPRMHSPTARYLAGIVGARAYMAGTTDRISGVVARGNKLTIHLLRPEPDFLSRISLLSFCAVPPDTPVDPKGVRMVPTAGPYYVSSYTPGQGVVLTRNPNYRGGRPRHFKQIQLAVGFTYQRAVSDVQAGIADYTPLEGLSEASARKTALHLAARYGPGSTAARAGRQQYFVDPAPQLDYFVLNTHRPLFASTQMRRAANYAIDRRALAQLGDPFAPLPERPADHYLPRGVAGFRDAHVYPLGPDVAKARQLAQGKGRTAVLYTCNVFPCPEQARIVKSDLAAIGLRVTIKEFPPPELFALLAKPDEPFDLAYGGWVADYPDPAAMLTPLLDDRSIVPTFEDPGWQRRLAADARLSGAKRYLAYGRLDLVLARYAAPLLAFGNFSNHDFFSKRIGCQTNGNYGIDLAALCIRG
jgi:YVTN family beta-propeller protein